MVNKGIQKIINIFLSVLIALTCINVYTVTAEDDTAATEDKTVSLEESSEQALDLNSLTNDELFSYIMSLDGDQMDALYDEYNNLDDLINQLSVDQKAQLAEKFGNGENNIETSTTYYGKFTPTIENATVAYCTWKGNNVVSNPTLTEVNGTVNISDYATNKTTGYIVFFVKPYDNYMITGLNASGNGDYYSLDSTSFGNIGWFAKQTELIKKAKSEGYIGVFGYSSSNDNKVASFEVYGQQPSLNVSAVSNKTTNVVPGDTLTFTVTITPNKTASGKDSITNVKVNEVKINGNIVEISDLEEVNGSYIGTVDYEVSEADCYKKKVELEVAAETSYECKTGMNSGDKTPTSAKITKTATAECYIAEKNKVEYEFVSGTEGKTLDDSIYKYLPQDTNDYFNTQSVSAIELTTKEVKVENGTWSFKGWDADFKEMTAEGITFKGTWTFIESNKYTVTYVVEEGDAPATYEGEIPAVQEYYEGASVTVADVLTSSEKNLSDGTRGTWTFTWDKEGSFKLTEDTIIRGTWTFKANENASDVGYYLVLDEAAWYEGVQPEGTYKSEGKNKYFYTNKYASGDTFTVTDKIPTADGYAFIGWFDKERNGQNAAIREIGDEITVNYNSKDTYCLDALWAKVEATGYTGTYDGKEHTIVDEISFESGKNWDEKYGNQAKKLITVNSTEYKVGEDGKWQTTKPTFKDVGTYTVYVIKSVTVGENTYQLETSAQVVINQKAVTVTADDKEKMYGKTDPELTASVDGLIDGDSIDYSLSREKGEDAKTYTITVEAKASQGNYTVTCKNALFTIKASQEEITVTVTGNSDTVTYDGEEHTVTGYTVTGNENTDIKLTAKTEASVSGTNATTYYMGLNKDSFIVESNNYSNINLVVVDGCLTIKASTYSVENPSDVTYNGESQKQSPVIKDGDKTLVEGKDYELKYSEDTTNAGKVTVTVIGKGNYEGCNSEVTYNINQKAVTVTADDKEKMYGKTDPELTASVDGLIDGDSIDYSLSREKGENVGTYTIFVNGEESQGNYTVTYVNATLTINKANSLTVEAELTGEDATKVYDGAALAGGAIASIEEGTTITYSINGGEYTTEVPSITNVGTLNVTAKATNPNYEDVTVSYTLTVTYAEAKVTANNLSKTYGEVDPELTATSDVEGITYNTVTREKGENVGKYEITVTGDEYQGNYHVSYKVAYLTIKASTYSVENPSDVTYNGESQKQSPVIKDGDKTLVEGKDYELKYSEDTTNAGKVTVTVIGKGNYEGEVSVEYNIKKVTLKVTTYSASKSYDGKALTADGEVTGLVNNETVTLKTNGSQTEVGSSTNTYELIWDRANKDNYTIEEELGTLTVTKAKEVNPTPSPIPDNRNNDSGNNNGGSDSNVVPAPVNPTPSPTTEPSKSDITPSEVIPEEDDAIQPSTDTETINDDATPENASKKKSWALINLICAVASMLLGIFLLFSKKEKEDDENDSNPNNVQMASSEDEETNSQVRHLRWKVVAVIDAIISIVLFILTEKVTLPMVLVDKWTLLMFALTCVNVVSLILGRFREEDQEEQA